MPEPLPANPPVRQEATDSPSEPADANARIADALARMRRVFQARPETAVSDDMAATASLQAGACFQIATDGGYQVTSDMPTAAGGGGAAPTPGWYFRAGLAACTATALRLYAAERGVALDALEVRVSSRSDSRGLLQMGDATAAMGMRVEVRLSASGVADDVLLELARQAHSHSPTNATILAGRLGELDVKILR